VAGAQDVAPAPFPGPDGNFYGNGVVVDKAGRDRRVGGPGAGTWFVPSISSPDYFLSIGPRPIAQPPGRGPVEVRVHRAGNANAAAAVPAAFSELPEFDGLFDPFGRPAVHLDQYLFLVPRRSC
jgi:hypothetical protein